MESVSVYFNSVTPSVISKNSNSNQVVVSNQQTKQPSDEYQNQLQRDLDHQLNRHRFHQLVKRLSQYSLSEQLEGKSTSKSLNELLD